MTEVWKSVPDYEGCYEISDLGRVRSLITNRILRPGRASNGYLTVALSQKSFCVHHLVAATFIGPRPPGYAVCHYDGDKLHNAASNLRYDTYAANNADIARHGRRVRGEGYRSAKLNDDAARTIRWLRGVVPQSELAAHFGVSPAAVQAVHDGRTWKHV